MLWSGHLVYWPEKTGSPTLFLYVSVGKSVFASLRDRRDWLNHMQRGEHGKEKEQIDIYLLFLDITLLFQKRNNIENMIYIGI